MTPEGESPPRNNVFGGTGSLTRPRGSARFDQQNLDEQKLTSEGAQTGSAQTRAFHGRSAMPQGKPAAAAPAARGAGQEGRPGGSSLKPQLPGPEKRSHSVWFKNTSRQWKTAASSAGCCPGAGAPAHRTANR